MVDALEPRLKRREPWNLCRSTRHPVDYSELEKCIGIHVLTSWFVSCRGVPWIATWLVFIWMWDNPSLYQMQVNFLIGLLLDFVLVAVLKAVTRRRRPVGNKWDIFGILGTDKFSFPSGHASRATMIACYFLWVWPLHFLFQGPIIAWAGSVCLSRLLLQRHHILDVTAGVLLGVFETWFIYHVLWLSQESAASAVSWLSDKRTDGGSYHV